MKINWQTKSCPSDALSTPSDPGLRSRWAERLLPSQRGEGDTPSTRPPGAAGRSTSWEGAATTEIRELTFKGSLSQGKNAVLCSKSPTEWALSQKYTQRSHNYVICSLHSGSSLSFPGFNYHVKWRPQQKTPPALKYLTYQDWLVSCWFPCVVGPEWPKDHREVRLKATHGQACC